MNFINVFYLITRRLAQATVIRNKEKEFMFWIQLNLNGKTFLFSQSKESNNGKLVIIIEDRGVAGRHQCHWTLNTIINHWMKSAQFDQIYFIWRTPISFHHWNPLFTDDRLCIQSIYVFVCVPIERERTVRDGSKLECVYKVFAKTTNLMRLLYNWCIQADMACSRSWDDTIRHDTTAHVLHSNISSYKTVCDSKGWNAKSNIVHEHFIILKPKAQRLLTKSLHTIFFSQLRICVSLCLRLTL